MRILLAALAAALVLPAYGERPRPPGTVPLDEPPPPPPVAEPDPSLERQQVTVRTEDDQTIEETRVNGKVVMVRVTPKHGRPYVLLDNRPDGQNARAQDTLTPAVRVPQWVLLEF